MQPDTTLHINGARLWDTLTQQARISATPKGGVRRLALTDLGRQGHDFFVVQAGAAGCAVRVDAIGDLPVHRPGHNNALPSVMTGDHIGAQPTGGRFDDSYGAFTDTEVVRALDDTSIEMKAPTGVAVWTNEESSHFVPVMMGSDVFVDEFALDVVLAAQDRGGVAAGEALRSVSYAGNGSVGGRAAGVYFEAHIEQGLVLEAHGKTVGVVTGALGQCWCDMILIDVEVHAGPAPMELRRDVLLPAAELVGIVNRAALECPPHTHVAVGYLSVHPDSRNVIPGQVSMTIDFRAADGAMLSDMDAALYGAVAELCTHSGINIALCQIVYFPSQPSDAMPVSTVRSGTRQLELSEMDVIGGTGHGAAYPACVAPTAMVFVPCKDGISRNKIEDTRPEHLEARINVLLHAMLQATGRV